MDRILLADFIVTIHLLFMLFVVLALFLILLGAALGWGWVRNPWFRIVHLFSIAFVAAEALRGIECPLTTVERQLREDALYPRISATLAGNVVGSHSENVLTCVVVASCAATAECKYFGDPYLHYLKNASPIGRFCNEMLYFKPAPEYAVVFVIAYSSFGLIVALSWAFFPPRLPWRKKQQPTEARAEAG